jgi:N-ethylmaleimide reductase
MSAQKLFTQYDLRGLTLKNRIVMSPMTRGRAINNLPNELLATYYAQRAGAGLIITEGVSPSPNGLGYARIPGIFSSAQTEAWKPVTAAVHDRDGHIFMQLMHTGRIGHQLNIPAGAKVLAPSAIRAKGEINTDTAGMQALPVPEEMSPETLQQTISEFAQGAINAVAAGFDGVELHGANGYLLEQFLSPFSNQRKDDYGGSLENRLRFVTETAAAVSSAIGKEKLGIRLSPYGVFNDMPAYDTIEETYTALATGLSKIGIAYIHIVDHSSMGAPVVPVSIKQAIRRVFSHSLILSGGYDQKRAESDLRENAADLIAFGKPFINNPDLPQRFLHKQPLSTFLDQKSLYAGGEKGYTDYPVFSQETVNV